MKIAVDAMGGDYAPAAVVEGAVLAARSGQLDYEIVLVGDEIRIKEELARLDAKNIASLSIVHCSEVVEMDELPVLAIRKKKDSSIMKAAQLIKDGQADALVSAGNTGAVVAATKIKWRGLTGIERPAIAAVIPSPSGVFVLLDVGATPDCKPKHIVQFSIMGDVYAKYILDIAQPKLGILSFGSEATKGTGTTKEAFKFLQESKLNFVGNIEGNDLFTGKVQVIACDGFIGNVVLKVCESLASAFNSIIKEEIMKDIITKLGALLIKPAFKRVAGKIHYEKYGGAPLLGVNGTCIICHGRSSPQAIKNAIGVAARMVKKNINERIVDAVKECGLG